MTYGKPLEKIKVKEVKVEQVVSNAKSKEDKKPVEEKKPRITRRKGDKPAETNAPVQDGVDAGKRDKESVGDIPAEKVEDTEVANAPTQHKDGTTTPPTGDDHHDYKGTADKKANKK